MSPQIRSHLVRFRRTPSRCQRVWQGILILATLALAYAANAQSACASVFGGWHTPTNLAVGSSVQLHYAFPKLTAVSMTKPAVRAEVTASAAREVSELRNQAAALNRELVSAASGRRAEISASIHDKVAELAKFDSLLARLRSGASLSEAELNLLRTATFDQKISLNKKSDVELLAGRLAVLEKNLKPIESLPTEVLKSGRPIRVLRFMGRHYMLTMVLVAAAYGVASGVWDLYASHEAYVNAPKYKVVYPPDEGLSDAPVGATHARDNPDEAVGN